MLKRKQKGFTIVELLIVIVVIAILAAISLVTYSGITQRSYAAKASSIIDGYSKIIQLYKVDNNSYPTYSDIGLGNYACLTPVGSLPPAPFLGRTCVKLPTVTASARS